MDEEYDEMFGTPDEYEQQFADELQVLAEMDFDPAPSTKRSEFRKQKPQLFQEAITAGDQPLRNQSQASSERSLGQLEGPPVTCDREDIEHLLADEPITPKAKRLRQDVAKKLFEVSQVDDITPPSSPEEFHRPPSSRPQPVPVILDISGFAAIQESPRRVAAATSSCHVLKRPPAEGGYVSVTDQTGNRVYLRQTDDLRGKAVDPSALRSSHNALGLLAVPIEVLREQVAEKRHRQVVEESQRLTELLNSQVDEEFGELDGRRREEGDREEEEEEESSRLWVDQFSPQHYTELLSDDFLHGRGKRQLDVQSVQSMRIGQKDQNKGIFNLWQEIFQLPRIKRKRVGEELDEGLREGGGAGEHDKLTQSLSLSVSLCLSPSFSVCLSLCSQGLYDNFMSMRVKDPSLGGVCEALDWLGFSDGLTQAMLQGQNFSLLRYQPFLPVAFHFLFAHTHVPRINYPHSQYEALTKTSASRNALAAMLSEVPACIRTHTHTHTVNPQLFSDREKQQLVDLIDTMISYNLSYRQDRTPDGQYVYVLEPQLTYQTKQTISRETDQERMRRAESLMQLRNPHTEEKVKQPKVVTTSSVRNHQQRLENILRNTVVEIRVRTHGIHTPTVFTHPRYVHTHKHTLDIICPKLRPVNPQLFSDREKQQLVDLIDTMISYNLSYRQDRTPDGQYVYVLEPRVEQVVCFPGLPPRRQLTYQTKQTISRETDQERMRRAESLMQLRNPHTEEKVKQPKVVTTSSVRNHQQRLENILRNTVVEIRPEVDFFGRAVAPKEKPQVVSATGEVCVEVAMGTAVGNSDVWFRFNEGVSNAVRRNVYIRELL
ncbi:chromosome transmission fidelity protein 18 homolog [Salmo salar]|uniref:Chromosome transmission fidelity protein 18 homolog n=1 Tax=Salmo salar TaxID=8030 RepID=A0ABM3CDN9_SALSA|nr:chromosome transmission fidelity protein 18 homolog [Salmo salar]